MRQDVIARQVRAMKDAGLDASFRSRPRTSPMSPAFVSPSQPLMRWRHAMALVTADGAVALVVVDMEASTIRAKSPPGTRSRVWGEFNDRRHGGAGRAPAQAWAWRTRASASRWTTCRPATLPRCPDCCRRRASRREAMLARLRQIKTPEEIDILRRLSRIADQAITEAYRAVHAGASEMDLAAALTRGVYEQGAEYFKLMIVATGERSVFPMSARPSACSSRATSAASRSSR